MIGLVGSSMILGNDIDAGLVMFALGQGVMEFLTFGSAGIESRLFSGKGPPLLLSRHASRPVCFSRAPDRKLVSGSQPPCRASPIRRQGAPTSFRGFWRGTLNLNPQGFKGDPKA